MHSRSVDVAIIGAGTAGLNARREVVNAGGSALLIESGPYGTTCARVGCMPSKLLIAAADVAHELAGANRFGIDVADGWGINGSAVLDRVRRERDYLVRITVFKNQSTTICSVEGWCSKILVPWVTVLYFRNRVSG